VLEAQARFEEVRYVDPFAGRALHCNADDPALRAMTASDEILTASRKADLERRTKEKAAALAKTRRNKRNVHSWSGPEPIFPEDCPD
jgi:hypothetical protein